MRAFVYRNYVGEMERKRRAVFGYPFQSLANYQYALPPEEDSRTENSENGILSVLSLINVLVWNEHTCRDQTDI